MWRVGLNFDLPFDLLLGQRVLEFSVAKCVVELHDICPWDLTYWPEYKKGSSNHQWLYTYQVQSFWCKAFLSYQLHKVTEINMTFDLDLWPTDLNINRDHLLIMDYQLTKFEASGAKRSWVISCTRLRETDIPTDRPTDRRTDICNAICPPFSKGEGHKYICY